VNACLDELRRRARRPEPTPDHAAAFVATADSTAMVADRVDIDDALHRVPLEFRAAVVLRDLCGLDYAEIGEVLSIPAGTVRSRIARGRLVLARLLAPQGNPDPPDDRPTTQS
jgi:RNA polymerase sigma-70 factor (ECF subfamily)